MTACPDADRLAALADGTVTATERAALEAHLDDCAACGEVMSELGGMLAGTPAPAGYRILDALGPGRWRGESALGAPVILTAIASTDATRIARDARTLIVSPHAAMARVLDVQGNVIVSAPSAFPTFAAVPRSQGAILAIGRALLRALASLHAAGIVHGSLSPDVIHVGPDHAIELAGFGAVVDEPAYRFGDQFAACTILWEALAGRRPYRGATVGALEITMRDPLEIPRTDRAIFTVLARGLAVDPRKRWPDIAALLDKFSPLTK